MCLAARPAMRSAFLFLHIRWRTTQTMSGFYRPMQCLSVIEDKIVAFVSTLGEPDNPIDPPPLICDDRNVGTAQRRSCI